MARTPSRFRAACTVWFAASVARARKTAVTSCDAESGSVGGGVGVENAMSAVTCRLSPAIARENLRPRSSSLCRLLLVYCCLYTYVRCHSVRALEGFSDRIQTFITRTRPCYRVEFRLQFFRCGGFKGVARSWT